MSIMNRFNKNDDQLISDEPWIPVVAEQLRQPLEASIAAQLSAARQVALEQPVVESKSWLSPPTDWSLFFRWSAPTVAGIFAIVLAIGLWHEPDNDIPHLQTAENIAVEDLTIIKSSDDLEFYQNLEFLLWMEQVDNGLIKG